MKRAFYCWVMVTVHTFVFGNYFETDFEVPFGFGELLVVFDAGFLVNGECGAIGSSIVGFAAGWGESGFQALRSSLEHAN